MDKRVRSPNYPALSLKDAIEKVALLWRANQTHAAPREVVAKGMGYNSLNGASATAISALNKYGLLEGRGEELRVSPRAMAILHPQSKEEKVEALRAAAQEPRLFAELAERFPGSSPSDELLKNYLLRNGFAVSAVGPAILAYRETLEFVSEEAGGYDSGPSPLPERGPEPMTPHAQAQTTQRVATIQETDDDRLLGRWDFEGGGYVYIKASEDVDTEEALDMVQTLIELRRKQLSRKRTAKTVQKDEDDV